MMPIDESFAWKKVMHVVWIVDPEPNALMQMSVSDSGSMVTTPQSVRLLR